MPSAEKRTCQSNRNQLRIDFVMVVGKRGRFHRRFDALISDSPKCVRGSLVANREVR